MSISALSERVPWRSPNLVALSQSVMLSHGWTRRAVAFGGGAAGALAMAPFNFLPALIVTLTIAVWLLDGAAEAGERRRWVSIASARAAAFDGWWLGFGYFVAGLWWLGDAFLVEADRFAWALPLGVLGLPAILALFTALGFALARLLWSPGAARLLALAVGLGLSEWLRGHLFTGFPWNLFGMALGGNLVLAQAASLVGVYGLTLIAIPLFAAPATLADASAKGASRWPTAVALAALAALALFGAVRLGLGADPGYLPGVKLRIMQPNLSQDAKFRPEYRDAILDRYLGLSDRATSPQSTGLVDVTHLIWPESAFPFILARDAQALARIGAALPSRATLITGAARMDAPPPGTRSPTGAVYNAVQVVASGGSIIDSSDKVHLVPFGEYLPFSILLNGIGLRQFVAIPGGFESGERRKALKVPGLPLVSPLICYEAIFSGEVMPQIWPPGHDKRPGLLLNVTNDGWFGRYVGPHQHFAQARLRSIEQGLPLVRAANTGISAVVDPYGRVLNELPVSVDGILDSRLPASIQPTFFAKFGNGATLGIFLLLLTVSVVRRFRV
jgi:apolipoprotein N-acyltransferase